MQVRILPESLASEKRAELRGESQSIGPYVVMGY